MTKCATPAGISPRPWLRRYERVRRSVNALAASAFDGINRVFSNEMFLPTLLRRPALGMLDRVPLLKRLLVRRAAGHL